MHSDDIMEAFDPLWQDVRGEFAYPAKRPLLAHYTSIGALERIMASDEVWFSNPLYMNDMEELRFGMHEGLAAFRRNSAIKVACQGARYELLLAQFDYLFEKFNSTDAFDTYVFCMAEHDAKSTDGLLSMWRGYGGNGNGAAMIFDTAQFVFDQTLDCLILSHVSYASQTERREWIDRKLLCFAKLLTTIPVPDDMLYVPVHSLFERLKVYSLFTKHHGFSEEREWRVVYLRERDRDNVLQGMLHYSIGRLGLEPKLKFKIKPIPGITDQHFSLEQITSQILLGPSVSSPLSVKAVRRMFEKLDKPKMADRLIASTTPFRAL